MLAALQMPQVLPVDLNGLIAIAGGMLMILIPVTGFTVRFAIKPITEAIARLRESNVDRETMKLLERRVVLLEQELQALGNMREDVDRIADAVAFDKQLEKGRSTGEG